MTPTDLPALREAVAQMTEGPWFWKPGSLRDIVTKSDTQDLRVCEAAPGNTNGEDDTKGIVALRNAAPALLDEVEALRAENAALKANADDDTAIVSRARDICHRHGYVVDAEHEGWTTCALRSLEAEVAAARKVLETAIELPGYYAYAVIDVDAAAWQAWQARRKP